MIRKKTVLGAASAGALALVATVGPAVAAGEETADVAYTCVTAAGNATPSAHYAVDAPPATMVAGQKVALPTTATFTLDATTSGLAINAFHWVTFNGTITTPPSGSTVGQNLTIAKTAMAPLGQPTVATATGSTIVQPTRAGTYTMKLGNLGAADPTKGNVTLNGFNASDALLNSVTFPDGNPPTSFEQCKNNTTTGTVLKDSLSNPATVSVAKDASTTAVTAAFSKVKHAATGTATVKGKTFKLKGTGTVNFTLKKGLRTVAVHKGVKLNAKGIAKTVFKSVTKTGKYSIVASYGGNAGLKASKGKAGFAVR